MSREKGDKLEDLIATHLGIKKTTNSGAKWDNADLSDRNYIIECKVKSKDGFQSCKSEIKKLKAQALKHSKEWIYIQQTNTGTYALIDYNFLIELMTKVSK